MTISIDGTSITGATIDGIDVQEITVDGTSVWTAGGPIIGIEWNQTQDTWQWIDGTGASITEPDWTQTPPWSDIQRVNMAANGTINAAWGILDMLPMALTVM